MKIKISLRFRFCETFSIPTNECRIILCNFLHKNLWLGICMIMFGLSVIYIEVCIMCSPVYNLKQQNYWKLAEDLFIYLLWPSP
ncbi:hypothetical protein Ahy_B04g070833 isoform A [Arachis hypogaea]|uniref:Uncharacterized protein n=1 Tax=Arachis hypogaea TaxID=3818 RepID=A0A444ZJA0_ARAHY|nr:hypothetical protein Ahy_B04g070833 isoform A [Arachis hypogaea]